jgi:hypothetical protein
MLNRRGKKITKEIQAQRVDRNKKTKFPGKKTDDWRLEING